ncbi:hypothetical protein BOX15_Mlig005363g2, partial [Macrostomum lignano]
SSGLTHHRLSAQQSLNCVTMLRSAINSRPDVRTAQAAFGNEDSIEDQQPTKQQQQLASSHGIFRLSQGSGVQRVLWALVVVGVCVGFILHLSMLVQQYTSYPVSTELEARTDFFEFPDVTICSTNYLSVTYGYDPVPSPVAVPGRARGLVDMIYDVSRFFHLLNQTDMNASVPVNPYSSYRHGKLALNKIAYRSKQLPDPYEIVLLCRFNSIPCSYLNFTIYKDDELFKCMTFAPLNNTVVRAGPGNGLYLLMYTYSSSFFTDEEEIDDIPGMKVVLHPRGVKPNMNGPHVMSPLKYKTEAVIDTSIQEKVDRSSYRCLESLPNATYITDYSQLTGPENETFRGSTEDCRVRIMQQEYLDTCGCLATHLPKPADLYYMAQPGVCHDINEHVLFRDIFYRRPTSSYTYYTIRNDSWYKYPLMDYVATNYDMYNGTIARLDCYQRVLDRQNREGVDTHGCPVLCRVKSHEVMPRYYHWPNSVKYSGKAVSNLATEALNEAKARGLDVRGLKDLVSNYESRVKYYAGVLDLYPRDLIVQMSIESWAYPLRNFFSDLGGILGLWIGASIVTLVEILELAMYGALLVHKKLADRKRNQVIVIKPHEQQQEEKPPGYNHSELETDQQMPEPKVEL